MGKPRAFISFDFDNNKIDRGLFVGQIKNSLTPFQVEDWSSKKRLPQKDWEELINNKINRCNILIVLVGKNTYKAPRVIKEIIFSRNNKVPIFGVYVDGANTMTRLPSGLQRNRTISWTWHKISSAINQCMKELKNR
ncbi:MAG: TIR domain-containing protein [Bacteroidota bacterium]